MSKEYWFPWTPARFRGDTMHLSAEQDGIYRRLIDHYMETGLPLPDNDAALARIAGISIDSWCMAAAMLRPFFRQADGKLYLKRCDEILADQTARSRKNAEKGKAGASKRWKSSVEIPEENDCSHDHSLADASPECSTRQDTTEQKNKEAVVVVTGGLDPRYLKIRAKALEHFPQLVTKESGVIHAWIAEADTEMDILPAIDLAKAQNSKPSNFMFFTPIILRAKENRLSPLPEGKAHGNQIRNGNSGGGYTQHDRKTKSDRADDAMREALTDLGIADRR